MGMDNMYFERPILFIVFNRPETTRQVLAKLKAIQPRQLFVAADGPRKGHYSDEIACKAVRDLVEAIDWPVEVYTLFREENLGCGRAVSGAIDWFFDHVESGIILEDDCLPDLTFFPFCDNLLTKYRDDARIMHISGTSLTSCSADNDSYYFSKYEHIWGWATWKRAWSLYDFELKNYKDDTRELITNASKKYMLDKIKGGDYFTWDYQWHFCLLLYGGICITPNISLVENIGYGTDSTHTLFRPRWFRRIRYGAINAISHPKEIVVCRNADQYLNGIFRYNPLKEWIKKIVKRNLISVFVKA